MNNDFNKNENNEYSDMNYSDGTRSDSENGENTNYAYQSVMRNKQNSRTFSIVSLILSIISVVCCCSPWVSLLLAVLGIVFSVYSRRNIGYFDGLSIAGLVVGIFGCVFSLVSIFWGLLLSTDSTMTEELEKYLEEILGEEMPNVEGGETFKSLF